MKDKKELLKQIGEHYGLNARQLKMFDEEATRWLQEHQDAVDDEAVEAYETIIALVMEL
jgi:pyrroloquinoline quinone (PQQ) biosynthesis protein C